MTGTHHHVHTKKSTQCKLVELALFKFRIGTAYPFAALYENDKCTKSENSLHNAVSSRSLIHSAKCCNDILWQDINCYMNNEKYYRQRTKQTTRCTFCYKVV